ncbi:MAG: hypothetical protein AB8B56_06105 [Crocinitomicaceae bacterium]
MKIPHFNSKGQEEATKRLFQLLFELQAELTNYRKTSNTYRQGVHSELNDLKLVIDVIMDRIITET